MTSGAAIAADSAVLAILARAFAAARRDCAICGHGSPLVTFEIKEET